ncbi:hypothetical protein Misp01_39270 [Microtetraspora sp. NBRC 13810]|uniref:hypothetical protein n=1 Tax=Microtetraspora sp. NBRC 13810 TaxID=3030990 RepID=UPI00255604B0|nr:hypothetical protein [Microtetraspora sp. NBRC 13810]GLW08797.1 hypothetical protein Misp01_39270 [Microtetraspora sp. NBRC 13810]
MDFWKTVLGLVRHRRVGPLVFVLALAAAAAAYFVVPTRYTAGTSSVLTTPATGGTLSQDPDQPPGLTNPLLQFSDGLRTTAGILILSMNTPEVAAKLGVVDGGPTTLTIDDGRSNPNLLGLEGPFVYIEAGGTSPAVVRDTVAGAQALVKQELADRQRQLKAPPSTYIAITQMVPVSTPKADMGDKVTATGVAFAGVLTGGIAVGYALVMRAAARRARAAADAPDDPGTPPAQDPEEHPDADDRASESTAPDPAASDAVTLEPATLEPATLEPVTPGPVTVDRMNGRAPVDGEVGAG